MPLPTPSHDGASHSSHHCTSDIPATSSPECPSAVTLFPLRLRGSGLRRRFHRIAPHRSTHLLHRTHCHRCHWSEISHGYTAHPHSRSGCHWNNAILRLLLAELAEGQKMWGKRLCHFPTLASPTQRSDSCAQWHLSAQQALPHTSASRH